MRILLLGATGRTGSLALAEALARKHTVTALVRRPDALPPQANLSIIPGTPLSPTDISAAFASAPKSDPIQAVISTLNTARTSDNPWAKPTSPPNLMADSVRNTLAVMKEYGVKKIVVLGTNGVGSSRANSGWFFNWIVDHSNLKLAFDDHYEVQKVLEAEAEKDESLKWVDVRATGLSNGEKKEVKEFGNEGKGVGWFVSRKSVAGFLLDAVEGKVLHKGSCHCGKVTFQVLHSPNLELSECNCSICDMKGYQGFVIDAPALKSLAGSENLQTYRFGTGTAQHMFCKICGISPLTVPRSYPDGYNVNYRCLDKGSVRSVHVTPRNGREWEKEMAKGNLGKPS